MFLRRFDIEEGSMNDEVRDELSLLSTSGDDQSEDTQSSESEEEKEEFEDEDDKKIFHLKAFLNDISENPLFDSDDQEKVREAIDRLENSQKRQWQKQANMRLAVLAKFDEKINLKENFPMLNKYFVNKHRQMMSVIASMKT